ncbi:hypothetical protein KJS94_16435 [Flavihumibacter rivuli]|uniref:alpha/beta hydrolase n=1 Tax=Flavihumibacter rivuli TaxID=2838156 RepID=UPI001BDE4564|nr:alpha/beta hydrolase-fold protein [Flavihumibacter rivuli]ULQ56239.1 hypothetical protein KJS94_16435 [Flavihumibacter rivuli]
MKKQNVTFKRIQTFIGLALVLILLNSCTKELFTSGTTREFRLLSNTNGASYQIQVGLPYNYNPTDTYETIYVLDGKEIFGYVANRCREISDKLGVKNVLVVGISYGKDRSIDYTPTKVSSITGGAPQFLSFIENQLIPKIESEFHASPSRESRMILGHSYGGLFGAYAFCVKNKIFGNYLLLSPSFWFDNQVTFKMEKDHRLGNRNRKQLIFMGIGGNEEGDRMLAPFETFYHTLLNNYPNVKLEKNIERNQAHMGSREPNIIKGLEFYFKNR